jgi:hypothetical protein
MHKNINETESAVPVNAMGVSSSGNSSSPIATFDPMLQNPSASKKKKLRTMFTRTPLRKL